MTKALAGKVAVVKRWIEENMPELAARSRKADDAFYAYWAPPPP
jgi:hypothetical protein